VRAKFAKAAVWAAIAALYLTVRVPLLPVPLDRDEGAFGSIAQALLRGEHLYADVFDHKPPGVFSIFAVALRLVPPSSQGVHLFLLVWNAATLVCVASVARALAGSAAAAWAAFFYAIVSTAPSVQGASASSEMLLLLPFCASLRIAIAALAPGGGCRTALLAISGSLMAATFWIKPPAILGLLAVPMLIVLGSEARPRQRATLVLAWIGGGAVASALVCAWFSGVWGEFLYWSFGHNLLYVSDSWTSFPSRLMTRLKDLGPDLGVPVLVALVGGVIGLRRTQNAGWTLSVLVLSFAGALHSGFLFRHYFAQACPAVALGAGAGAVWLGERWAGQARRGGIALVLAALAIPAASRPWYWIRPEPSAVSVHALGVQMFEASPVIADYLRSHSAADDAVFIYGSEPQIALLAARRNANPFTMAYPLTGPWPRTPEFQREAWRRLLARRPLFVLVARTMVSLMASPSRDRFLEDRLAELHASDYPLDACLADVPGEGRMELLSGFDGRRPCPGTVYMEIWKRAGSR
jgi:hypothetical protein